MNAIIATVLIGSLYVTSYRSVPNQTDRTPNYTSTGEHVKADGVAVSQDLLCGACRRLHHRCAHPEVAGRLHYGDWVFIEDVGFKRVNDVMNKRFTRRMDVWVGSWAEEHKFHMRFKNRNLLVYKAEYRYETEEEAR